MTNFKERFDSYVAEANSAVANTITDFDLVVPGLKPSSVKRLFNNISRLLGRIDREGGRYPELLIDTDGSIPEQAIDEIAGVKTSAASGAENLITASISRLGYYERILESAVGFSPKHIKDIKSQHVRELHSILADSQSGLSQLTRIRREAQEGSDRAQQALNSIQQSVGEAKESASAISRTKQQVEKWMGDARGRDSLERLIRDARKRTEEISVIETDSREKQLRILQVSEDADNVLHRIKESLDDLSTSQDRANAILRGATQAGLAGAYKAERDRLAREQFWYAAVFYGGVLSILLYAIIFILPVFSQILSHAGAAGTKIGESALLVLARLFVLAPVVWALMFTNRRYIKLETLQMDHAAKAATALAYSGYKDEMQDDADLSNKLKDGLLVRFMEHPERLLNKSLRESVEVTPQGGVAYTSTSEPTSGKDD